MKAVLFDMDGVILDSMAYHVRAWQMAMEERGLRVSADVLYLHEGAIEPETAVDIFQRNNCPMDAQDFAEILARQKEIFSLRFQSRVRPYPEVPGLLEEFQSRGWELALVTSSHSDILDRILPEEIRRRMALVVTGDQVSRRKPFPDPYIQAGSALGLPRSACMVVENAPAGIQAAKSARMTCYALTTTLSEEHLAGADAVFRSHADLQRHLLARQEKDMERFYDV